jgi:hypothetical protein
MIVSLTVAGRLEVTEFKQLVLESMVDVKNNNKYVFSRFRQHYTYWLGFVFFQWDEDFHIDQHVRSVPERVMETDKGKFIHEQIQLEFASGTSPWEFVLAHDFNAENRTLVVFRQAHGIGDGLSMLNVLAHLVGEGNSAKIHTSPSPPAPLKQEQLSVAQRLTRLYKMSLGLTQELIREMSYYKTAPSFGSKDFPDLLPGFWPFFSSSPKIPMGKFKSLSSKCKVALSTAITSAISSAVEMHINKYFEHEAKQIFGAVIQPKPGHPNRKLANHL